MWIARLYLAIARVVFEKNIGMACTDYPPAPTPPPRPPVPSEAQRIAAALAGVPYDAASTPVKSSVADEICTKNPCCLKFGLARELSMQRVPGAERMTTSVLLEDPHLAKMPYLTVT